MDAIEVREALRDAMSEEMHRDSDIIILGEEVAQYNGAYKVTRGLLDEFGEQRVIDTPITEHGFAGMAVGAAMAGLRPVVEFMTFNFAMQAIDHLINSSAKLCYMSGGTLNCPIVFRGPNGFAAGVGAQHSQCYASWYAHIPGLKVIAPFFADDCKGLLKAAIRDNNPVIFLEHELTYGFKHEVPDEELLYPIGKARTIKQGNDLTIVSFSYGMHIVMEASEILREKDIDVEIIDLRSLRPLDIPALVESVQKTGRMLVVEGGWPTCGIGAAVAARVSCEAFDYLDAPIDLLASEDVPQPYAALQEAAVIPSVDKIVAKALSICNKF